MCLVYFWKNIQKLNSGCELGWEADVFIFFCKFRILYHNYCLLKKY